MHFFFLNKSKVTMVNIEKLKDTNKYSPKNTHRKNGLGERLKSSAGAEEGPVASLDFRASTANPLNLVRQFILQSSWLRAQCHLKNPMRLNCLTGIVPSYNKNFCHKNQFFSHTLVQILSQTFVTFHCVQFHKFFFPLLNLG